MKEDVEKIIFHLSADRINIYPDGDEEENSKLK